MKRILLAALTLTLFLILNACGTAAGTPAGIVEATPDPLEIYIGANSSQRTAQAAQATAEYFGQQITATVHAQNAFATERAWSIQQTQAAAQITSTARAWELTVTADSARSTATAAATQTAQSLIVMATSQAMQATSTANYANGRAYATAMAGEAERVQQAVERDRLTNTVKAVAPWIALALAFPVTLLLLYFRGRMVIVPRDERGDAKLLMDVVDGVVTDADRQLHPQGGLRRNDLKLLEAPPLDMQAGVTERDQMLDLATRPGADDGERRRQAARQMTERRPKAALPASVTIVPPEQVRPVVQDVIPPLLMDATEGEVKDE